MTNEDIENELRLNIIAGLVLDLVDTLNTSDENKNHIKIIAETVLEDTSLRIEQGAGIDYIE